MEKQTEKQEGVSAQLVAPPTDEHALMPAMLPHFGPYAGQIIRMPQADADAAVAAHWATALPQPPFDPNAPLPPNLTPEERQAAEEAAAVWAAEARGEPVPGPTKDKDKDQRQQQQRRDVHPEQHERSGYETREVPRGTTRK